MGAYPPAGAAEAGTRVGAAAPYMLRALKCAEPWLGKLIADGGHRQAAMPGDAVKALAMVSEAIRLADEQRDVALAQRDASYPCDACRLPETDPEAIRDAAIEERVRRDAADFAQQVGLAGAR